MKFCTIFAKHTELGSNSLWSFTTSLVNCSSSPPTLSAAEFLRTPGNCRSKSRFNRDFTTGLASSGRRNSELAEKATNSRKKKKKMHFCQKLETLNLEQGFYQIQLEFRNKRRHGNVRTILRKSGDKATSKASISGEDKGKTSSVEYLKEMNRGRVGNAMTRRTRHNALAAVKEESGNTRAIESNMSSFFAVGWFNVIFFFFNFLGIRVVRKDATLEVKVA
ncbi:uncharacterized protein G2W53_023830 [Senna tora]|uniref:Uncharacterized protein n=1 Tax=Senna tora TaxID=362788 RepID=A0A834WCJ8_9FABA|nr:uncharacterized protein G2W53_023830 [Senna tora]